MTPFRAALLRLATLWLILATTATVQASHLPASKLCLVPVVNGEPTADDLDQSYRMVNRVVVVPGVDKPVVYPLGRDGVWTVGKDNTYKPFGGEFPRNSAHDVFVTSPVTGFTVAANPLAGVFVIRPGDAQFTRLYGPSDPFQFPRLTIYVERLGGFVIVDPTGLYLLSDELRLSPLPFVAIPDRAAIETPIDLPKLQAMVIGVGSTSYLREDDGSTTLLVTLEKQEYVVAAELLFDGRLRLETNRKQYAVTLDRDETGRIVGAHAVAAPPRPEEPSGPLRVEAHDVPYYWRPSGLWTSRDQRWPVKLPFDVSEGYISDVEAHPVTGDLIVFSSAGIFTLEGEAPTGWRLVPQSERVVSRITRNLGMLWPDRGMLLAGTDRLYLLAQQADDCLVPLSQNVVARKVREWAEGILAIATEAGLQASRISIDEIAVHPGEIARADLIAWGEQAVRRMGGALAERAPTLNGASLRILSPHHHTY